MEMEGGNFIHELWEFFYSKWDIRSCELRYCKKPMYFLYWVESMVGHPLCTVSIVMEERCEGDGLTSTMSKFPKCHVYTCVVKGTFHAFVSRILKKVQSLNWIYQVLHFHCKCEILQGYQS